MLKCNNQKKNNTKIGYALTSAIKVSNLGGDKLDKYLQRYLSIKFPKNQIHPHFAVLLIFTFII